MDVIIVFLASVITVFLISLFLVALIFWNANPYPDHYRSEKEKIYFDPVSNEEKKFPNVSEPHTVHLSVIVPAYNEEERLPPMLDEALEYLDSIVKKHSDFKYEVIIVSDGSTDKTVKVALKYSEKKGSDIVRVLELNPNIGKGGAVTRGVLSSRGALILFADADGATKFSDLSKLENELYELVKTNYLENPYKVSNELALIVGSRAHLEEEAKATRSLFRTILMHGFHFLVWSLAVRSIRDTQCGFKLFTRKTAEILFSSLHVQRWAFDVELLYLAEHFNIPMSEVCVNWTEIDGSKIIPVFSWLQMGKDLILIWLRYRIGAWKVASKKL